MTQKKQTKTEQAVLEERARCIRLAQQYVMDMIPHQKMEHVANIGLLLNNKANT